MPHHGTRPALILILALPLGPAACRVRETPDAARAKVQKVALEKQLESLQVLLEKAERGELVTAEQVAIGVDETVAREILNLPMPLEQVVGEHARIRIESAEPFFRGNQALLLFRARVTSQDLPNQYADLELAGGLEELKLVDGRLRARIQLLHFSVQRASVGPLAQGLVETLIRTNLGVIQDAIPPFEVPVSLEQQVRVDRFEEGPVSAAGGELPLTIEVAQVLALGQRLWVLIDAKAGPWTASPASSASPAAPATPTADDERVP
jgi:hypothetical protein